MSKASRTLGFVARICKPFKKAETLLHLYNSLVRSTLEYNSSIWFPIYSVHNNRIESIQARAVRYACMKIGLRHTLPEYHDRLNYFHMQSLEHRRLVNDMVILYKIVNSFVNTNLITKIKFKCTKRPVRHHKLFVTSQTNNNVSRNSGINRMCDSFNKICSGCDIFAMSLTKFKMVTSELLIA